MLMILQYILIWKVLIKNVLHETKINNQLENVNIWLKFNNLSLNAQKAKLMVFHRKQKKFNEIHLSIDTICH